MVAVAGEWRALGGRLTPAGITRMWPNLGLSGTLAAKNLLSPALGAEIGRRFAQACQGYRVVPKPCFGCQVACAYKVTVTSGPRQGFVATMAGGGENMEGAAAMVAVAEPADILWLTDRYDRLGLNTSTTGCAVALAFECYERGILTTRDTGGLELRWGDAQAAARLLDMIVAREGLGAILAEGPGEAARRIGQGAENYAVHIKGVGFNLHDWRGKWQTLLAQAVASAGPRWEGTALDTFGAEPSLGYTQPLPPFTTEGIAEAVRKSQMKKLYEDSLGVCWFILPRAPHILELESRALAAAIGWPAYSVGELLAIGERVANMERVFNLRRGLTPADDLNVSPRMLEPPADGPAQGRTIGPLLREAVLEYYRLMGWDEASGRPRQETLARLGLGHLAEQVW